MGSPADAVVWEEVEARTSEGTELSSSFLAFMVVATLIAAVGILTDSIILIIGAMVVGPEFGPLAALCVALVERRLDFARRSAIALAIGFPAAILASYLGTLAFRWLGTAPDDARDHPDTLFISDPSWFSVVIALLAGVAGMLSLTTAKSGALVGVLISVTTIPAAANVGVAAAYARVARGRGRRKPAGHQPRLDRRRGRRDAGRPALGLRPEARAPPPEPRAASSRERDGRTESHKATDCH